MLSLSHGAVVTSGGVSIKRGLSIWIEAILARGLGPELYGVYAFGWRLVSMVLRFANLGADMTLLRDLPAFADEPDRRRRSVGLAYLAGLATFAALLLALGTNPRDRLVVRELTTQYRRVAVDKLAAVR